MATIKDTLKENMEGLLSEEVLSEIETAFNSAVEERAKLQVESALVQQDDDHAEKVGQLLEAIDTDHTKKLERIVEAVTLNHTDKLKQVIRRYSGTINEEAGDFKSTIVESISNYLDLYLDKTFPKDMLEEAITNKRAQGVLGEVRKLLSVDMALANDSIRNAVVDGKNQINEASTKLDQVVTENSELKGELDSLKACKVLEELATGLPDYKKKYVYKVLSDKNAQFIQENFNYTLELFDKQVRKQDEVLKEEAKVHVRGSNIEPEVIQDEVIQESATDDSDDPMFNTYMGELGKY